MRLVFIGPPGAGKGTQAKLLREHYGIQHISSGDMIRDRIASATPTGLKAKPYYDGGSLVPDQIIVEMVIERLAEPDCSAGFLLDGFPRTSAQAAALDQSLADAGKGLDAAVLLVVQDEEVVRRLSGRRTCPGCGSNYHIASLPPRVDGRCDLCASELVQRMDDDPQTIRQRLRVYHQQTEEVVAYYRSRGLLREVRGMGTVEEIQSGIRSAVSN